MEVLELGTVGFMCVVGETIRHSSMSKSKKKTKLKITIAKRTKENCEYGICSPPNIY